MYTLSNWPFSFYFSMPFPVGLEKRALPLAKQSHHRYKFIFLANELKTRRPLSSACAQEDLSASATQRRDSNWFITELTPESEFVCVSSVGGLMSQEQSSRLPPSSGAMNSKAAKPHDLQGEEKKTHPNQGLPDSLCGRGAAMRSVCCKCPLGGLRNSGNTGTAAPRLNAGTRVGLTCLWQSGLWILKMCSDCCLAVGDVITVIDGPVIETAFWKCRVGYFESNSMNAYLYMTPVFCMWKACG